MKKLDLLAELKSTATFVAEAGEQGVDLTAPPGEGKSLLQAALSNSDLDSRYATVEWLLDRDAYIDGATELHILFAQRWHRIDADVRIARRLIARGADINALSPEFGLVFCEVLWMKYTDEDLEPIYDLWFEQPGPLDFTSQAANGREPLGMARALPYRSGILARMERYLAELV